MILTSLVFLWFLFTSHDIATARLNFTKDAEIGALKLLNLLNDGSIELASKLVRARWDFETNKSEATEKAFLQASLETIKNVKRNFVDAKSYPWKYFANPEVRRQLKIYSEIGTLALPEDDYREFQKIILEVDKIQRNATICDYFNGTKCDLHLYPDIQSKLSTSQNSKELLHLRREWKKATEDDLANLLAKYVKFCNRAAIINNYANFQDYSLRNLEMSDVKSELISLWEETKPLYGQIHAYVRRKLREIYGEKVVPRRGLIPSHLLGNFWLENWSGIAHRMLPFPELDILNFTSVMINQVYTPELIHRLAEEYFSSMNFSVPRHLWYNDSSEKSNGCEGNDDCHFEIFNFYKKTVRVKDCRKVSMKNFLSAHGILTEALYMLQYSEQPYVYQSPVDPGLEKALKDIIKMSASTFTNLRELDLFKGKISEGFRLNRLFKLALEKITAISFLLVQELWRWEVYSGKPVRETIHALQELREKFQGISTFTKELSFDPGGTGSAFSKLSLAHHFLGYFIEFQMYEDLCKKGGGMKSVNLDECNLSKNVEAGQVLRNLMNLGSSKSLKESLAPILGRNKINSESLLRYFDPLTTWLRKGNELSGEPVGWEGTEDSLEGIFSSEKIRQKRSANQPGGNSNHDKFNLGYEMVDGFRRVVRKKLNDDGNELEFRAGKRKSVGNHRGREGNDRKTRFEIENGENYANRRRRNAAKMSVAIGNNMINRRFPTQNEGNSIENWKDSGDEEEEEREEWDDERESKPDWIGFTPRSKRQVTSNYYGQACEDRSSYENGSNEKNVRRKRSEGHGEAKSSETDGGSASSSNSNGNADGKGRFLRKARKNQRRFAGSESFLQDHNLCQRKKKSQHETDGRGTSSADSSDRWHADSKKDISRLLHTFGFAMENEEKDKIKEFKKKLKGDSNSDLKSNIASKENTYENLFEYNRMKPGEGKNGGADEKGANKLWSVKSFMRDNAKVVLGNPSVSKKDNSQGANSLVTDEKLIGKKETSSNGDPGMTANKERGMDGLERRVVAQAGDFTVRHLNIDVPSLQALLKTADFYGQKPIFTITSGMSDAKARNEISQMLGSNRNSGITVKNAYKYGPNRESAQYKDKKEFREDSDAGFRSPYIIILGQITPEMRDRLLKERGAIFVDSGRTASQLQVGTPGDEKQSSEKRTRSSDQVYIVPIDLKNGQQNLMKSNEYSDNRDRKPGQDSNGEGDEEDEEQNRLEDESNFRKTGKENPSEFVTSWKDKKRKIVKRRKRDRGNDVKNEEKMKVMRMTPIKESILEELFGKAADQGNLEKNVKILIPEGFIDEDSDLASAFEESSSPLGKASVASSEMDRIPSRQDSYQLSSALSPLASSVFSALSHKNYNQMMKESNQQQHQGGELNDDNAKENDGLQSLEKEEKEQDMPFLASQGLRCNALMGKKKGTKFYSDEDKKPMDVDSKGDDVCCKKIILTPCPPRSPLPPTPGPGASSLPCPMPCTCSSPSYPTPPTPPCPTPSPGPDEKGPPQANKDCCPNPDLCCKKPSECSLVNCQFRITKAKKPHERLTIMIYDRINPPGEMPEPYDALAVISEILQRIQCCSGKPGSQLTEEDPDYPANDNSDQLKTNQNQQPPPPEINKSKVQELSGEIPILGNDSQEDDETDDSAQNSQNSPNGDENKYQPREKATPAIDQLTVFNRDKLKPVLIDMRKLSTSSCLLRNNIRPARKPPNE